MQPILFTSGLTRNYETGTGGSLKVLKGIDLVVRRGEVVAIIGPSGVGKSTLLHIIGALDRPTAGTVEIDGQPIFEGDEHQLARYRNTEVGFIFQFHHLLQEFTALENVMMPALIAGVKRSEARKRAASLLRAVKLESRAGHRPGELSGGEQQRVAVARALMNEPKLLLADEPSGNLDRASAEELHRLLWNLSRKAGQTIIVVTHNMQLAQLADRIIRLEDGKIVEDKQNEK